MNPDMQNTINEIKTLMKRKGFAYALCMMAIEDTAIDINLLSKRNTEERLSSNEFLFLWSLLINQKEIWSYPERRVDLYDIKCEIHDLMDKLHISFLYNSTQQIRNGLEKDSNDFKSFYDSDLVKESIFYGGGALYDEEYIPHIKEKYLSDKDWLVTNKNYHIDSICKIGLHIKSITSGKTRKFRLLSLPETMDDYMEKKKDDIAAQDYRMGLTLGQFLYSNEEAPSTAEYCNRIRDAISFSDEDLAEFEGKDDFLKIFSFSASENCNQKFHEPGDFSILLNTPIIMIQDGHYLVTDAHQMFKSLYDVPGYWLKDRLSETKSVGSHFGDYAERRTTEILKPIFGAGFYRDIIIKKGKNQYTDIDALCIWKDKAICFQVKSKGLTLESRRGNLDVLQKDFNQSFQAAYKQGKKCQEALLNRKEYKFIDKADGKTVNLPIVSNV